MVKVTNMTSSNGNKIANQFIIEDDKKRAFQSYSSVIAIKDYSVSPCQITLDSEKWDYSVTTGKYRNMFLNETKKETEKKIKDGTYKLADLNGGE
jgi:hypothetical protein